MQDHAARVFAQNLRAILLAPPVRGRVMGLDPGFRSGCKVAVLDEHGSLLETEVIFPHDLHGGRGGSGGKGGKGGKGGGRGGGSTRDAARDYILSAVKRHRVGIVAIGNGTASQETQAFVSECIAAAAAERAAARRPAGLWGAASIRAT